MSNFSFSPLISTVYLINVTSVDLAQTWCSQHRNSEVLEVGFYLATETSDIGEKVMKQGEAVSWLCPYTNKSSSWIL